MLVKIPVLHTGEMGSTPIFSKNICLLYKSLIMVKNPKDMFS